MVGTPVVLGDDGASGTALSTDVDVTLSRAFNADSLGIVVVMCKTEEVGTSDEGDISVSGGQTSWTLPEGGYTEISGYFGLWVFHALESSPSGTTVSVSWEGTSYEDLDVVVIEIPDVNTGGANGADAIAQVVLNATNAGGNSYAVSMNTLSDTTNHAFLLVGAHANGAPRDYTNWGIPGTYGWQELHDSEGYGEIRIGVAYKIGETATDPSLGYTISAGTTWLMAAGIEVAAAPAEPSTSRTVTTYYNDLVP